MATSPWHPSASPGDRRPERSGRQAPFLHSNAAHRLLWLALGAVLGAVLTFGIMVFSGPRPTPLPAPATTGTITLTVDDDYLSIALRQAISGVPFVSSIQQVQAHCAASNRIYLSGQVSAGPLGPTAVTMTLQPFASGGQLHVRVLQSRIGDLPLPAAVNAEIESAVDAQLHTLARSTLSGYAVTGVDTSVGHLTIALGRLRSHRLVPNARVLWV